MTRTRRSATAPFVLLIILLLAQCTPAPVQPPTATAQPTPEPAPPTTAPTEAPSPTPPSSPRASATPQPAPPPETSDLVFAVFTEEQVDLVPDVAMVEVVPGLENVTIPFILSETQMERLAADGFVVSPGTEKEFFTLYEKARYRNVPIFVSSDSLLHVYHLMFDKVLRTAEVDYFIPLLKDLNQALIVRADAVYQDLQSTTWEDAARRTVAFIAVAGRLTDAEFAVPPYAEDLVEGELANITSAAGFLPSPIFPGLAYGEDYTQYIPRGHYTLSDELKAYFKSMMWYGRMTFRLRTEEAEVGRAETRSALLLVHVLQTADVGGRPALELWQDLYSPTVFFVGRSDDLTVLQYANVMDSVYGEGVAAADLVDEDKLTAFIDLADQLPPPQILGIVIMDTDDEEAETKGMRFMGQRFVPDAYIFRQLIYRNVGTRADARMLPKGLDIFAAMGSERAYELLDAMGDTAYVNYPSQMMKVQAWLESLDVAAWTETLYTTWLYTFYPLIEVRGEGYPAFMQSPAWLDKQLNTVLGSWAELKHDTILYAKQVYAELGGGPPPPEPIPPRGYVEPVPQFYARLAALTAMTREGLESRDLLTEQDAESLQQLEDLAGALQTMAEKELRGEPLTEEEYRRIRYYGGELEHLTMAASDTESSAPGGISYLDEEPQAAVVADVATDPDGGRVLEVAVGRINELHAIVPIVEADGSVSLQVAQGGVFSYYEFPWPMDDRLTDDAWRAMLDNASAPDPPAWTQSFFTDTGAHSELEMAVFQFQDSVTNAFWMQRTTFRDDEPALAQFQTQIADMAATRHYMGHQLVRTHFRSFDYQSPTLAVVTVRETWQDALYTYDGDYPEYEETALSERGPYTLDATYTLEAEETTYGTVWRVTQAVYADAPPAW